METIFKTVNNLLNTKIVRFFLVAFIATVLNYLIFYICFKYLHVNYMVSSAIGFISGVFLGYQLNSKWTFKKSQKSRSKIIKYYAVYLFSLGVSLLFLRIFVEEFYLLPQIANVLCIFITFCTNYVGTRFWVFKEKSLVSH